MWTSSSKPRSETTRARPHRGLIEEVISRLRLAEDRGSIADALEPFTGDFAKRIEHFTDAIADQQVGKADEPAHVIVRGHRHDPFGLAHRLEVKWSAVAVNGA